MEKAETTVKGEMQIDSFKIDGGEVIEKKITIEAKTEIIQKEIRMESTKQMVDRKLNTFEQEKRKANENVLSAIAKLEEEHQQ